MKIISPLLILCIAHHVHAINARHVKYQIAGNADAAAVPAAKSETARRLQGIPKVVAIDAPDRIDLRHEISTSKHDVAIELLEGGDVAPAIVDDAVDGVAADPSRIGNIRGGVIPAPKQDHDGLVDGSLLGLREIGEDFRRLNIFDESSKLQEDRITPLPELSAVIGTCGGGNVGNGVCLNEGECCSQFGWCGVTAEHCGGSIFGTCGGGKVGNGVCSIQGQCCSQHGWCDVTPEFCDGPRTCGSGNVGNGICPIQGECCSQFGWCGVTAEHCGGVNGTPKPVSSKPTTRTPTSSKPTSMSVSPQTTVSPPNEDHFSVLLYTYIWFIL